MKPFDYLKKYMGVKNKVLGILKLDGVHLVTEQQFNNLVLSFINQNDKKAPWQGLTVLEAVACNDYDQVIKVKPTKKQKMMAHYLSAFVRNSYLEELHSGITPSSKTGTYSDVKVITPYGEIPWSSKGRKVSRISDEEMHRLMMEIQTNLEYGLAVIMKNWNNPVYVKAIEKIEKIGYSWNRPDYTEVE